MTTEEINSIIDRYLNGEASPSEKRLIDTFVNTLEKKQTGNRTIASEEMWAAIEDRLEAPRRSKRKRSYALMALGLFLFMTAGLFYYYKINLDKQVEWITKDAPFGQKSIITLTDGSKVFLNSGSSVSFPKEFSAELREIRLTGEAFFEVVRNPLQPFHVHTGNVTTKVLGTSFNVQAFDNEDISITVATGKVQVVASIPNDKSAEDDVSEAILNPMEQGVFKGHKWITSQVELPRFLAWKNNTLRFEDAAMSQVAGALERWYNVQIEFENEQIKGCMINGQFKDQSLKNVLNSIRYMYNIDYRQLTQNQIILYGKGCKN
ncbi:MAG TPA: FecR domain-containing protein [Chryseolinea sp.]|nr:FecR domain-containing protein [Chryseolinea sp.]